MDTLQNPFKLNQSAYKYRIQQALIAFIQSIPNIKMIDKEHKNFLDACGSLKMSRYQTSIYINKLIRQV
ncbi:MAG: hypothetical protein IPL42_05085 [Saprospiraceae bacterium]|nr:hypothetical protein [Saprospiraceae bacterium]